MSRPAAAKPKSSLARARSVRRLHALPKYWLTKVELEQQRRGKFSVQVYIATVPGTHTRGPRAPASGLHRCPQVKDGPADDDGAARHRGLEQRESRPRARPRASPCTEPPCCAAAARRSPLPFAAKAAMRQTSRAGGTARRCCHRWGALTVSSLAALLLARIGLSLELVVELPV